MIVFYVARLLAGRLVIEGTRLDGFRHEKLEANSVDYRRESGTWLASQNPMSKSLSLPLNETSADSKNGTE
jgi:hypothetical protein